MAIINRTLDSSQQREVRGASAGAVATGVTGILAHIETPCVLDAAQIAAFGLSGAPNYQIIVNRFIAGSGATAYNIGSTMAAVAFGTSGVLPGGFSLPASGSTLLNLLQNDVLMYLSGGANAAVTGLSIRLVIRPIQDLKKWFGNLA